MKRRSRSHDEAQDDDASSDDPSLDASNVTAKDGAGAIVLRVESSNDLAPVDRRPGRALRRGGQRREKPCVDRGDAAPDTVRSQSVRAPPPDGHVMVAIPRSALAIFEQPVRISQRNCERALGLPKRTYLELCREFGASGGEVVAVGKLRSVRIDDFERWLRARRAPESKRAADADSRDDSLEELANELGVRLAEPRRGRSPRRSMPS